jgi:hypothetical protein
MEFFAASGKILRLQIKEVAWRYVVNKPAILRPECSGLFFSGITFLE